MSHNSEPALGQLLRQILDALNEIAAELRRLNITLLDKRK